MATYGVKSLLVLLCNHALSFFITLKKDNIFLEFSALTLINLFDMLLAATTYGTSEHSSY